MKEYIIGIDEAGRGPLAGPIVAAAVLNTGSKGDLEILENVFDSKKMTPAAREKIFIPIIKNMIWSVRAYDNNFIDKYGIQTANVLLVYELARDLSIQSKKQSRALADYVGGADKLFKDIYFFKGGESQHREIAAASIVAKVYRDRLMMSFDKVFPGYDFVTHKGYGTKKHYENLSKLGPSPIHRKTFLKV